MASTGVAVVSLSEWPPGLAARRVGRYYAFLIAPRKRVAPKSSATAAARALRDLPFVGYHSGLPQHAQQRDGLRQLGFADVPQALSAASTEALLAFVREGLGFSLIPWPHVDGPPDRRITAIRVRRSGTEFPVLATYRPSSDPLVAAALDALD